MAKETLLDFVQDILSDADGDDVNSISDTVESDQCARVIRDVWRQIVSQHDMEHIKTLKQLTATSGTTPTVMTRPENFHALEWVRYDSKLAASDPQAYKRISYMDPDSFVEYCSQFSTSATNVEAMTLSTGHIIPIQNDRAPKYFTIMDFGSDELVFDAYNSALETNLQQSKSLAYGTFSQDLVLDDASTIDLPRHLAVLVKREARAIYFDLYKDGITSEIDRTRRRAEVRAQRQRNTVKNTDNDTGPDYGRK
jgi:hypothetical protein